MKKEDCRRLNLKNGWDLPNKGRPPLTGHRQELIRAYELLVKKTDDEYLHEVREPDIDLQQSDIHTNKMLQYAGESETATASQTLDELYDLTDGNWKKRRKKHLLTGCAVAVAAVVVIGGRLLFGSSILTADISTYQDVAITIEGLTEEPFEVTPKDLSKMRMETIHVDVHEEELGPDDVKELGKAIGPTVETFLSEYGFSLDEVRSMKVYAENETSTAYVHTLEDSEVILSVANGRRPLGEKEAPLRIAVDTDDAGEWSGWIRRIVFTLK